MKRARLRIVALALAIVTYLAAGVLPAAASTAPVSEVPTITIQMCGTIANPCATY